MPSRRDHAGCESRDTPPASSAHRRRRALTVGCVTRRRERAIGTGAALEQYREGDGSSKAGEITLDGPGSALHVICAAYDYDCDIAHPLLSLLPPALFVSPHETSEADTMQAALSALLTRLASPRPRGEPSSIG